MRRSKIYLLVLCLMLLWTTTDMAEAATVKEKVSQIVSEVVTSGMSQLDKASALHDWLTDHACYDLSFKYYGPEGVLLHGTGVCQSYSEAYKLLLEEAGIHSHVLTGHVRNIDGTVESHAWNLVEIDGKWKHVDVTWDDPIDESEPQSIPVSGLENHMYFMVGSSVILTDHVPDEASAALIGKLVGNEVAEELPDPVVTKALAEIPDFSFTKMDGTVLTKDGYGKGRKLIIVYGRTTCMNTTAFLGSIFGYISELKNHGITVVAALYDNPSDAEIWEMETRYPGVVCARVGDADNSMWEGLFDMNMSDGMVIFPVVFLKNTKNAITYCSTGFVDEPLKIVAGALHMNEDAAPKKTAADDEIEEKGTENQNNDAEDNTISNTKVDKTASDTTDTKADQKTSVKVKSKQPMTVKARKVAAIKASKLKKKKIVIKRSKILTIKKYKGKLSFKKISGNKKISVNKKTGAVTLKKGLKKGSYRLKVKVKAAGTGRYKAGSKNVSVKIRVK